MAKAIKKVPFAFPGKKLPGQKAGKHLNKEIKVSKTNQSRYAWVDFLWSLRNNLKGVIIKRAKSSWAYGGKKVRWDEEVFKTSSPPFGESQIGLVHFGKKKWCFLSRVDESFGL